MIELEGLTKRYDARTVVDDVSLTIPSGSICRHGRHLRLGQVDGAAHDQPPGDAHAPAGC